MRVLLVDDEPLALTRLKIGFRDIPETTVVGTAGSALPIRDRTARMTATVTRSTTADRAPSEAGQRRTLGRLRRRDRGRRRRGGRAGNDFD